MVTTSNKYTRSFSDKEIEEITKNAKNSTVLVSGFRDKLTGNGYWNEIHNNNDEVIVKHTPDGFITRRIKVSDLSSLTNCQETYETIVSYGKTVIARIIHNNSEDMLIHLDTSSLNNEEKDNIISEIKLNKDVVHVYHEDQNIIDLIKKGVKL